MRAHHPPGQRACSGDLGYPDDRGVGRQDGVRSDERLHLPEESALGLEILEDALEDEIGPVKASSSRVVVVIRERVPSTSSAEPIPRLGEKGQVAAHPVPYPTEQFVVEALQSHLESRHRESLAASLPHHAGRRSRRSVASSACSSLVHQSVAAGGLDRPEEPCRLACTQYMPSRFRPL